MQRKKRIILALTCAVFLGILAGCGQKKEVRTSSSYGEQERSAEDAGWTRAETDTVLLENGRMRLEMDAATGHFTLEDKGCGAVYYSAVTGELEGAQMELSEKAQSELVVSYYDENSQKLEMNSNQHSVAFGNFDVLADGSKIRVYYRLQLEADPPFVPEVLDETLYQRITENLDSNTMFKLKLMYKVYEPDNETTEAGEIRKKYPYGEEHTLYILNSSLSDTDMEALSRYMEQASYTREQYEKDIEAMGIELEEKASMQFTVPVEYSLTEDGFDVRVLTDLITGNSEEYTLQSVAVLPYFNCGVVSDQEGFLLLPDGSGSIMRIDDVDNAGYSQKLYGNDIICENQVTSTNTKNACMPLFGYSSTKGSYISYVDGAAAMAKICAYRAGNTEYCAHVYPEFELYSTDNFTMRKTNVGLAVFSTELPVEQPCVQYHFLDKKARVMDMASWYRDELIESGKLTASDDRDGMNLYLEFTGYIEQDASFMGISYQEKVVLSTLKDIKKAVEELYDEGIENVYVRLTGYAKNGGKYHGMSDAFSLEPKVGTMDELKELAVMLEEHGGGLFLEDDFLSVYKDTAFDSFSSTSDVIRRLDRTLADVSDSDLVTGETENQVHVRYMVSPKLYESMAESFRTTLTEQAGTKGINVSVGDAGRTLLSDFNSKDEYDRVETGRAVEQALEMLKGDGFLMTDVGNEYVLTYTDHLLNMALSDSAFSAESFSIPFYQLVLHGRVSFAGEALNMTRNQEKVTFDSLLSGANPYYSCVTDKEALESLKGDQDLYPTAFEVAAEEIKGFYQEHQELYALRAGEEVEDFEILQDGLYQVTYQNQVSVIFNETKETAEWNGQEIEAKSYTVVRK